jgi:hypothetical protein
MDTRWIFPIVFTIIALTANKRPSTPPSSITIENTSWHRIYV